MVGFDTHFVADVSKPSGVAAFLAANGQDQIASVFFDQPFERILSFACWFADGIAQPELAPFRDDHCLDLHRECHQFIDVLGRLTDQRDFPGRGDLARSFIATFGIPRKILELLGGDRFAGVRPAKDALDLGMIGIAVDDQKIALSDEFLGQTLDLSHQWAGRIDQFETGSCCLFSKMRSHPMCGYRDPFESFARGRIDGIGAMDTFFLESFYDLRIVNDVANRRDRTCLLGRFFDDVERAPDTPAITELIGDNDFLLSGSCICNGCHDGDASILSVLERDGPAPESVKKSIDRAK